MFSFSSGTKIKFRSCEKKVFAKICFGNQYYEALGFSSNFSPHHISLIRGGLVWLFRLKFKEHICGYMSSMDAHIGCTHIDFSFIFIYSLKLSEQTSKLWRLQVFTRSPFRFLMKRWKVWIRLLFEVFYYLKHFGDCFEGCLSITLIFTIPCTLPFVTCYLYEVFYIPLYISH